MNSLSNREIAAHLTELAEVETNETRAYKLRMAADNISLYQKPIIALCKKELVKIQGLNKDVLKEIFSYVREHERETNECRTTM